MTFQQFVMECRAVAATRWPDASVCCEVQAWHHGPGRESVGFRVCVVGAGVVVASHAFPSPEGCIAALSATSPALDSVGEASP